MIRLGQAGELIDEKEPGSFVVTGDYRFEGRLRMCFWTSVVECKECGRGFDLSDMVKDIPPHCIYQGILHRRLACESCGCKHDSIVIIKWADGRLSACGKVEGKISQENKEEDVFVIAKEYSLLFRGIFEDLVKGKSPAFVNEGWKSQTTGYPHVKRILDKALELYKEHGNKADEAYARFLMEVRLREFPGPEMGFLIKMRDGSALALRDYLLHPSDDADRDKQVLDNALFGLLSGKAHQRETGELP